jgi:hypothetical protein
MPRGGITVTLPKPMTSGPSRRGASASRTSPISPRWMPSLPTGERLPYRYTNEEAGKMLRRYRTTVCQDCSLKPQCTTGPERRVTRWEHEHLLKPCSSALTRTHKPCVSAARRSNIRSHDEGAHGCDALPDQDTAEGRS